MAKKKRVLFVLNNAPNYRNVFLEQLAQHVELTVLANCGRAIGLREPSVRKGYRYLGVKERILFGINWNWQQFTKASGTFDLIILGGISIRNPFLLLNLIRSKQKFIFFGHIYSNRKVGTINRRVSLYGLFRRIIFKRCRAFLVHSDFVKEKLKHETSKPIYSFNNTYFFRSDVTPVPFDNKKGKLNILWVGRYTSHPNKLRNITYLIDIARRNKNVNVRLIGNGIKEGVKNIPLSDNVEIYGEMYDDSALEHHFRWSHVVMNPGNLGLLVVNAARFGRPVIVDNNTAHPPEIQLALDSGQIMLNFDEFSEVDKLIESLLRDEANAKEKELAEKLVNTMYQKYTIEYMLEQFLLAINTHASID